MPQLHLPDVLGRLAGAHVPRAAADVALARWAREGGALTLVGPPGAGGRHLLDRWGARLRTRSAAWVRLARSTDAWGPVAFALQDPALPRPAAALPRGLSEIRRAHAAAALLADRADGPLVVLVDDVDEIDRGTRRVVRALAALDAVSVCATARTPSAEVGVPVTLEPLTQRAAEALVAELLDGPASPAVLTGLAGDAAWPGDIVGRLLVAVHRGLLTWDDSRWDADAALSDLDPAAALPLLVTDLTPTARALLELLAAAEAPVPERMLPTLLAAGAGALALDLEVLAARGLALRQGSGVTLRNRAVVPFLTTRGGGVRAAHRALVHAQSQAPHPFSFARHLVAAADPGLARQHGPRAVAALAAVDPEAATDRGRALLRLCPGHIDLTSAVADASARAGRCPAALELADELEATHGRNPAVAPVLATAARAVLATDRDDATARALVRRARHLLAGEAPPLALVAVEARLHARAGQQAQALATARKGLLGHPPDTHDPDGPWLELRRIEAEALARTGHLDAAVERLFATPPRAGTPAREVLLVAAARTLRGARRYLAASDAFAQAARNDPHSVGPEQVAWMDEAAACQYHAGDRTQAVATWRAAIGMAQRLGLDAESARMRALAAGALRELCEYEAAAQEAATAHAEALAAGAVETAFNAALAAGDTETVRRGFDEAARWYRVAGRQAATLERPAARARLDRRLAELAVTASAADAGERVAAAVRSARRADHGRELSRAHALRAVLLASEGRVEQVQATIDRALAPLRSAGASRVLTEVRLWAAQALLIAGKVEAATEEATRSLVWADEVGHVLFKRRAEAMVERARARGEAPDAPAAMARLLEIAVALSRESDLNALLDRIADAALHLVEADRAFVILGDEEASLAVAAARHAAGAPPGRPSMSVARKAIQQGREVIVSDVAERSDLRAQQSIVHLRVRSAMCLPLVDGTRTLGALYVDSHRTTRRQLDEATQLLRGLAAQAAVAVTNARLLAESRRRAEWAAEVTHDLRSPIAAIVMATEDILDTETDGLTEDTRETLELVREQAQRVLGMAERFLADRPGQQQPLSLAERVGRLVEVQERAARVEGRRLTYAVSGEPTVVAVAEELDRAVTNLLSNALQHTPAGTAVEVTVGLVRGEAVLSVRDHGPGIPAGKEQEIFLRGQRATTRTPGHGLGLAIVRRVVEEAGGQVTASTHPGGGAEFRVRLPLARGASNRAEGSD